VRTKWTLVALWKFINEMVIGHGYFSFARDCKQSVNEVRDPSLDVIANWPDFVELFAAGSGSSNRRNACRIHRRRRRSPS